MYTFVWHLSLLNFWSSTYCSGVMTQPLKGHDTVIEDDVNFVDRSRRTVRTTQSHVFARSTSSYAPSMCALILRKINRRSAFVSSSSSSRKVVTRETREDRAEDEGEELALLLLWLSEGDR